MRKRIAIFGATGMIGSALYASLKDGADLVLVVRDKEKLAALEGRYGGTSSHAAFALDTLALKEDYMRSFTGTVAPTLARLLDEMGDVDAVVQCMGVINRYNKERPDEMLFINAALPHALSAQFKDRLIHVTTDCVFDGSQGAPYDETSVAAARDLYGLTKRAGEPSSQSLVLRTSMIGPEIAGFSGLLEWVRQQNGNTIEGYQNALWNGVTTFEFARICRDIIERRSEFPATGLYHIFSTALSKYEMVRKIAEKYRIDVEITPDETVRVDRRLATRYELCAQLAIPSFDEMLARLP